MQLVANRYTHNPLPVYSHALKMEFKRSEISHPSLRYLMVVRYLTPPEISQHPEISQPRPEISQVSTP